MRSLIIALLAIAALFITPANAFNELRGIPIQQIVDDTRVAVEKLNDADAALLDEKLPRPVENSTIYLVKHDDSVVIALVVEGVIVISSPVLPMSAINKFLGRVGA